MRSSGSSSVTSNRATVLISSSVYDRRAIDSPLGSLPLSSSLQHLAYLTSTSPRIREIVTTDGGLERLMVLVGRCLDRLLPESSSSAASKGAGSVSFDDKFHGTKRRRNRSTPFKPFSAYINVRKRIAAGEPVEEWIDKPAILQSYGYALQSLVNVGVRGSEAIRTRVVDSGVLLTVARILNTFLAQRQQERERRSALIAPSKSITLWREDTEANDDAAGSSASAANVETAIPAVHTIAPTPIQHHPMHIGAITSGSPLAHQQQQPPQHGLVLTLPSFVDARMMSASPTTMSFPEDADQSRTGEGSSRQTPQNLHVSLASGSSSQITTPAPSPTASTSSAVLSLPPFISRLSANSAASVSAASSIRRTNTPDTIASIDETIEDTESQGVPMREARVVSLGASCDEANDDAESASIGGAATAEELDATEIPTDTDDGIGSTTSSRANSRSRTNPAANASIVKCPSNSGNTDTDMDDDTHDGPSVDADATGVELHDRQHTSTNTEATPISPARTLTVAPEHAHSRHVNTDVAMHGVPSVAQRQLQANAAAASTAAHRAPSMSAAPQRQLNDVMEDAEDDDSAVATAVASVVTSTNPSSQSLRDTTSPQMAPPPDHLLKEDDVLHCLHLLAYLSKYPHVRAVFHDPEHEEYRPVPPPLPTTSSSSCAHVPKRRRCGENGEACSAAWDATQSGDQTSRDDDADDDDDDATVIGGSRLPHNRPSRSHHHHQHHHQHAQPTESRSYSLPRLPSASAQTQGHFLAVPGHNSGGHAPSHSQSCCADADLERAKALAALPAKDRKPAAEPAKPPRSTANNVFSLVEQFTFRPSSPAERSMRLPTDIQYWAGVIMRNACRKDELRGGIRQCANMGCGVWERFPREFAKCRRCRKAKYCSKGCQKRAWQAGHRYWCSARQDNPPPSGNAHVIGLDGLAVDPEALVRAAADNINILINTDQLDGDRNAMDTGNGAQEIRLHDL